MQAKKSARSKGWRFPVSVPLGLPKADQEERSQVRQSDRKRKE